MNMEFLLSRYVAAEIARIWIDTTRLTYLYVRCTRTYAGYSPLRYARTTPKSGAGLKSVLVATAAAAVIREVEHGDRELEFEFLRKNANVTSTRARVSGRR